MQLFAAQSTTEFSEKFWGKDTYLRSAEQEWDPFLTEFPLVRAWICIMLELASACPVIQ